MGLTTFLRHHNRNGRTVDTYKAQLAHPWCWPVNEELNEQALALAVRAPLTPALGEALLVGVREDALFRVGASPGRPRDALDLRGQATASARLARRIIARDLPLLSDTDALLRQAEWFASIIAVVSDRPPVVLDGESYGLALGLATASLVLGQTLPSDLASSAALNADGALGKVDCLARKIEIVIEDAPGVRRFLVHPEQREEAERARDEAFGRLGLHPWLEIIPAGRFDHAFREAFGDVASSVSARWTDVDAARLIDALYHATLFGHAMVLGWGGVVSCASALLERGVTREQRDRLDIALAIAKRHNSQGTVMSWPEDSVLALMPRPRRLRLLAHIVQSAADAGGPVMEFTERAARHVLPRLERAAEDCVLIGALGRALAAAGNEEVAADRLREAIEGWHAVGTPHEMSFALCELLRVLGMAAGDGDENGRRAQDELVLRIDQDVSDFELLPQASETSIGFVRLAAARALVQARLFARALGFLEDDSLWPPLPRHVEAARLRWLARALDAVGRGSDAIPCRQKLATMAAGCDGDIRGAVCAQLALARIDLALSNESPTEELLDAIGDEGRRLRARCPGRVDPARFVADRYRY